MRHYLPLAGLLLVAACSSTPTGPTIVVMPGDYTVPSRKGVRHEPKTLEQFAHEDGQCKHYAAAQVEGEAARQNWLQTAVPIGGTLLGAGLGAAAGGGKGAAIGAASGALGGSALSGMTSVSHQSSIQDRYNIGYAQCMQTYGNVTQGRL